MTSENFVYWLQGFMEIGKPETLNKAQVQEIKNHIALVLEKVTPSYYWDETKGWRELDTLHTSNSAAAYC